MKKILALILCMVMILCVCSSAYADDHTYQKVKLGWGTTSSEGTIVVDAMKEFKAIIEDVTGGNVTIDLYPGSVLGSASDMLEQCQLGTLAMTNTQPAILAGIGASEQYVLSMPYLFSNFDQRWNVIYGEIGEELNQIVTDKCAGIVGFSYFGDGARHFFTNFEINSLADLSGKKLRVQNTELDNDWCTALGALPTPTSSSEMYQAMSTGMVDGAEQPIANYVAGKFTEVSKYLTLDGHTYNTIGIVVSEMVWNSLEPELQKLMSDTWNEVIQGKKSVIVETEQNLLKDIEAMGIKVSTPSDLADWAGVMTDVYAKYADAYGIGDYITRIQAVE